MSELNVMSSLSGYRSCVRVMVTGQKSFAFNFSVKKWERILGLFPQNRTVHNKCSSNSDHIEISFLLLTNTQIHPIGGCNKLLNSFASIGCCFEFQRPWLSRIQIPRNHNWSRYLWVGGMAGTHWRTMWICIFTPTIHLKKGFSEEPFTERIFRKPKMLCYTKKPSWLLFLKSEGTLYLRSSYLHMTLHWLQTSHCHGSHRGIRSDTSPAGSHKWLDCRTPQSHPNTRQCLRCGREPLEREWKREI